MRTIFLLCFFMSSIAHAVPFGTPVGIVREPAPFPGYLYRPNDNLPHPAILLLHGSEGGNGNFWTMKGWPPAPTGEDSIVPKTARYYASLGYVTYALCYFDCRHHEGYDSYPPDELRNVDLREITYKALAWLKGSRFVGGKKLVLWGASRGAEQAVLAASLIAKSRESDPSIVVPDGVVALSPREVVVGAFTLDDVHLIEEGKEPVFDPSYSAWIYGSPLATGSTIEIGHYTLPLFISFFEQDPIWEGGDPIRLADPFGDHIDHLVVNSGDTADALYPRIQNGLGVTRTFLDFHWSGHVFPVPGSEGRTLQDRAVVEFFRKVMQ